MEGRDRRNGERTHARRFGKRDMVSAAAGVAMAVVTAMIWRPAEALLGARAPNDPIEADEGDRRLLVMSARIMDDSYLDGNETTFDRLFGDSGLASSAEMVMYCPSPNSPEFMFASLSRVIWPYVWYDNLAYPLGVWDTDVYSEQLFCMAWECDFLCGFMRSVPDPDRDDYMGGTIIRLQDFASSRDAMYEFVGRGGDVHFKASIRCDECHLQARGLPPPDEDESDFPPTPPAGGVVDEPTMPPSGDEEEQLASRCEELCTQNLSGSLEQFMLQCIRACIENGASLENLQEFMSLLPPEQEDISNTPSVEAPALPPQSEEELEDACEEFCRENLPGFTLEVLLQRCIEECVSRGGDIELADILDSGFQPSPQSGMMPEPPILPPNPPNLPPVEDEAPDSEVLESYPEPAPVEEEPDMDFFDDALAPQVEVPAPAPLEMQPDMEPPLMDADAFPPAPSAEEPEFEWDAVDAPQLGETDGEATAPQPQDIDDSPQDEPAAEFEGPSMEWDEVPQPEAISSEMESAPSVSENEPVELEEPQADMYWPPTAAPYEEVEEQMPEPQADVYLPPTAAPHVEDEESSPEPQASALGSGGQEEVSAQDRDQNDSQDTPTEDSSSAEDENGSAPSAPETGDANIDTSPPVGTSVPGESEEGSSNFPIWALVLIGVAVLSVLAVGTFFVVRHMKRRRESPPKNISVESLAARLARVGKEGRPVAVHASDTWSPYSRKKIDTPFGPTDV